MRRLVFLVPLGIFAVLVVYFAVGLTKDPKILPSVLINREVPPFDLPAIQGPFKGFANRDLIGQVTLVNVFGSWCIACRAEHPFLVQIKSQGAVPIYGIDWREVNRVDGPAWLARLGNPYTRVGDDPDSAVAIAFGVTGAPESFIVDKKGVIRYKQIGPITPEAWDRTMLPLIRELQKQ
ncbi:DsbE family thiol:disulfide interchange protein [Varunaivibrio sulfuroxidans]|uniref:Cytochrome c biogenesis protein CcmG/thiol:disulfide interchange protein DsbE n=1 Tax=Varunaivibrio sulfuroxidans TaxID=1773489 RepID=A0A4R3JDZ0_9PROT|nr:DsbE family thiol:disulfide interchange protein [Varunaivibrio sulfuroxidans]TCS63645.1 cytochrome c biogenesis protein CcmG/thiol:disulfide interchange protein DsbE [Varunaivibrio sulfuroxidans]WES30216.1 DsbE family thiol:disulfide interchange protein [Varunaivibrio sulfuroxidans]